jgi:hypothetical protein
MEEDSFIMIIHPENRFTEPLWMKFHYSTPIEDVFKAIEEAIETIHNLCKELEK